MAVRHRTVRDRTAPAGGRPAAPELAPPLPDLEPIELPVAPAEVRALNAVQRGVGQAPVVRAARGMSLFGEHAAGWLLLGGLGAFVDRRRRSDWLTATAGVAVGARCVRRGQAGGAPAPARAPVGPRAGGYAESVELPFRARHVHDRRGGAVRPPAR